MFRNVWRALLMMSVAAATAACTQPSRPAEPAATSQAASPAQPAAPAQPTEPVAPTAVLFENVRVFNGTASQLSAPTNVLVEGHVIKAISAGAIQAPTGMAMTRIEGGGRTLMPGLIDNHVHILVSTSTQEDTSSIP